MRELVVLERRREGRRGGRPGRARRAAGVPAMARGAAGVPVASAVRDRCGTPGAAPRGRSRRRPTRAGTATRPRGVEAARRSLTSASSSVATWWETPRLPAPAITTRAPSASTATNAEIRRRGPTTVFSVMRSTRFDLVVEPRAGNPWVRGTASRRDCQVSDRPGWRGCILRAVPCMSVGALKHRWMGRATPSRRSATAPSRRPLPQLLRIAPASGPFAQLLSRRNAT